MPELDPVVQAAIDTALESQARAKELSEADKDAEQAVAEAMAFEQQTTKDALAANEEAVEDAHAAIEALKSLFGVS